MEDHEKKDITDELRNKTSENMFNHDNISEIYELEKNPQSISKLEINSENTKIESDAPKSPNTLFYNMRNINTDNSFSGNGDFNSSIGGYNRNEFTGYGQIRFKNKKYRSKRTNGFLKAISLILIAAVSGGATSVFISRNRYNNATYSQNNLSLFEQKDSQVKTADIPRNAINRVAETVGPTVVGISIREDSFYGQTEAGSGSGIIFDSRGYIVTNYHVIKGADTVVVKLANRNKPFNAKFIGADTSADLAVIKIEAQNLPVAKFGDSTKVKVGDIAIAIGNPLGDEFAGSVTSGIISAINRKIQIGKTTYKLLQTDAAINPGNSGGALCNEAGEIIGINSLKLGGEDNIEGMGFAININEANEVIKRIMNNKSGSDNSNVNNGGIKNPDNNTNNGRIDEAQTSAVILGVQGVDAKPEDANGLQGVYVNGVVPNSGAQAAGIKPADIIVEFDGAKVTGFENLKSLVARHKIDDEVNCKIWRDGKNLELKVKLTEIKS